MEYRGTAAGSWPAAPAEPMAEGTKRSLPPMASKFSALQGSRAPVAWREEDQVLPMLRTSGPWPEAVAARIRFNRSDQGTTSSLTLMPVCSSNFFSSGPRAAWSAARSAPWLEAQYVSSLGAVFDPAPSSAEPPPQAVAVASRAATAAVAAAVPVLVPVPVVLRMAARSLSAGSR